MWGMARVRCLGIGEGGSRQAPDCGPAGWRRPTEAAREHASSGSSTAARPHLVVLHLGPVPTSMEPPLAPAPPCLQPPAGRPPPQLCCRQRLRRRSEEWGVLGSPAPPNHHGREDGVLLLEIWTRGEKRASPAISEASPLSATLTVCLRY